jgi:predicted DNA-binding protein (MmcQ/YjbR family)
MPKPFAAEFNALRKIAMRYPDTREDHPWGHSAFKVKGKAFLFVSHEQDYLSLSLKLPRSRYDALRLPFVSPTTYGLGKAGWVTAKFVKGKGEVPLEMIEEWIAESFRAIAPRRVLDKLDGQPSPKQAAAKPRKMAKRTAK